MKDFIEIKKNLFEACLFFVQKKQQTISSIIISNKKALLSETKSSAGDKHETGRAMIQLEMEKAGAQLAEINEMNSILKKINTEKTSKIVCLGSLIITNKVNYYLAISVGKITINIEDYYVVSTSSPIGKQLLGIKIGDVIPFNNAEVLEIH